MMDFPLPPLGEGLYEVELVRWLVRPGDVVGRGQALMEVLSDKATMEVPSPFAGTIQSISGTPGAKLQVGQVVLSYASMGETISPTPMESRPIEKASALQQPVTSESNASSSENGISSANGHSTSAKVPVAKLPPAAPSVRLIARKLGLDLSSIRGTGPHGRILLDDLNPFFGERPSGSNGAGSNSTRKAASLALDFGVAGTRVKVVGLRRRIAERMIEAKKKIPHYSYIDECDFSELVKLRNQLREPMARLGVKLTYLAFVVKAASRALKAIPIANSSFDEISGELIYHDRYNIGIAVATPHGLIVPVIKDVDKKDLAAIAGEIERIGRDGKEGRSRAEDLKGGTFTVTSVGGIGGLISTPIVNYPEVAILGLGKVVKRPVYDEHGNLRPADIAYLSFSFDHRIVDGAVGAAFGNAVVKHLTAPATLLLPESAGG